jgi:hypothetical protein
MLPGLHWKRKEKGQEGLRRKSGGVRRVAEKMGPQPSPR